jgi:hypothetical protein
VTSTITPTKARAGNALRPVKSKLKGKAAAPAKATTFAAPTVPAEEPHVPTREDSLREEIAKLQRQLAESQRQPETFGQVTLGADRTRNTRMSSIPGDISFLILSLSSRGGDEPSFDYEGPWPDSSQPTKPPLPTTTPSTIPTYQAKRSILGGFSFRSRILQNQNVTIEKDY